MAFAKHIINECDSEIKGEFSAATEQRMCAGDGIVVSVCWKTSSVLILAGTGRGYCAVIVRGKHGIIGSMPRTTPSDPTSNVSLTPAHPSQAPGEHAANLPASLLSLEQLRSVIESLLFVAGRPLELNELRKLLPLEQARLREAVASLADECEREGRGIRVQRMGDAIQFVSAPENARFVASLLGLPTQVKLTTAALETLAVVAYRQPITRSQIEFIRGVNSDRALSSLVQHGLATEVGRAATVGRPTLFGTTSEFLQQFGLSSLEALPRPEMSDAEAAVAFRMAAAQRIREAVGVDEPETHPATD
jgi:segregation and condensation protein B